MMIMATVSDNRPDGEVFDDLADSWWDTAGFLHGLNVLLAPVRMPDIRDLLRVELGSGPHNVLDLGAGGGLLAEALEDLGLAVVAVDPSVPFLHAGSMHGRAVGSGVDYVGGVGERLPFADGTFDAVVCMEVLEHVADAGAVVSEAARVLRRGGVFIYSGPNRTAINRVGLVLVAQDLLGLIPRGTHAYKLLIRPSEMDRHMRSSAIEPGRRVGVGLRAAGLPRAIWAAPRLLTCRISYPEAARQVELTTGSGTAMAYQGFGLRR